MPRPSKPAPTMSPVPACAGPAIIKPASPALVAMTIVSRLRGLTCCPLDIPARYSSPLNRWLIACKRRQDSVHRCAADAELPSDLRWTDPSSAKFTLSAFTRAVGALPLYFPSTLAGDADQHALFNQLSLELGDSAEHVEHEPAGRGGGASAFDGEVIRVFGLRSYPLGRSSNYADQVDCSVTRRDRVYS